LQRRAAAARAAHSTQVSCALPLRSLQVFLWDVASGRIIRKFRGHDRRDLPPRRCLRRWAQPTHACARLPLRSAVNAVAFGGGGDVVVTGGYDQSVRCWDARSNSFDPIQVLAPFKDSVTSVLVDGHVILAASVDGSVRSFDVRAGRCAADALGAPVTVLALSRDGACVLAALAASRLRLLDRASGALLAEYAAPGKHVNAGARCGAALSADDAHVVAASENGRVTFWELVDAAVVASLQAHAPGKTARAARRRARACARVASQLTLLCCAPQVCGLAFHPSEAAMLTCATDGLVKAWRAPARGERGEED
jgi:WD40 repeat protein